MGIQICHSLQEKCQNFKGTRTTLQCLSGRAKAVFDVKYVFKAI